MAHPDEHRDRRLGGFLRQRQDAAADPTRPVGFVNVMLAPHGKCRVSQFADVLMINRYYGWYTHTGDLDNAEVALEEELRHPSVVVIVLREMTIGAILCRSDPAGCVREVRVERLTAVTFCRNRLLLRINPFAVRILRTHYDRA